MTGPRILFLAVVLVAIAFTIYQQVSSPVSNDPVEAPGQAVSEENVIEPARIIASQPHSEKSLEPLSKPLAAARSCLSLEQLESHPILVADAYRFNAVTPSGPTIASYRSLSSAELGGLAAQGDSAAMVVLGAISEMRARNLPEHKAVPYLLFEESNLSGYSFKCPLEPETAKHFEEASSWFYKAALHGRVMALSRVGQILWTVEGGPIELGWIDGENYDALKSSEKNALNPMNVYNALAFEIAPNLRGGLIGTLITEMLPRSERQQLILDELAKQFNQDLDDAELPPIIVPESTAPPVEEMMSLLCEPFLDSERKIIR